MAISSDLIGLGMAPALAGKVGHAVSTGVSGAGTAQTGATKITTSITVGVPTTGQTAYALPTIAASPTMGKEFYFCNNAASAVTALIYPPGDGSTLNGSTSGAVSVAQNKSCIFLLVANPAGTADQWFALNSA